MEFALSLASICVHFCVIETVQRLLTLPLCKNPLSFLACPPPPDRWPNFTPLQNINTSATNASFLILESSLRRHLIMTHIQTHCVSTLFSCLLPSLDRWPNFTKHKQHVAFNCSFYLISSSVSFHFLLLRKWRKSS